MKTSDFRIWLEQLSQLSRGQEGQVRKRLGLFRPTLITEG